MDGTPKRNAIEPQDNNNLSGLDPTELLKQGASDDTFTENLSDDWFPPISGMDISKRKILGKHHASSAYGSPIPSSTRRASRASNYWKRMEKQSPMN